MNKLNINDNEMRLINSRIDSIGMEVAELKRKVELSQLDNRESLEVAFQQNSPLNFGPLIDEYVIVALQK